MNVNEIAERLGGTVQGDGSIEITDVNGMELAQPGQITFLADKKFLNKLKDSRASAVIVQKPLETDKAQVIHPAPALAFAKLLAEMKPEPRPEPGIDKQSSIAEGVKLGKEVTIGPFVSVGKNVTIGDHTVLHPGVVVHDGCTLGDHTTLHAHVTLYRSTVVGNHVTIHAGAVIGADGFGYTPDEKGRHFKINQTGRVVIEDHVEIGANTCIDRANFGETVVREGTKIDNLTQIAHNCEIGQHAIIVRPGGPGGQHPRGQRRGAGRPGGRGGSFDHRQSGRCGGAVRSQPGSAGPRFLWGFSRGSRHELEAVRHSFTEIAGNDPENPGFGKKAESD